MMTTPSSPIHAVDFATHSDIAREVDAGSMEKPTPGISGRSSRSRDCRCADPTVKIPRVDRMSRAMNESIAVSAAT